ncbi:hypothetical protein GCM10009677_44540 [Sphaerisporangium rubeum]|uniref:DNA-binding SARP family transcriptional activator n=1 Tax=Sphaerisporangium rubeum TaxID=321317 RepID=A0A7X0M3V6_9ACTN|nr:AfsR/SARP family transcriptional regulator [Sphaerisporangium rubeum]MBB6471033.1 DNA-binding SARP family transcriptional activator [Sphaerisporangium rubeum]
MEVKLLGPLSALQNHVDILPTADKPRQIFAVLALNPNKIVPAHVLIEEVWGERPPRSAGTTLQTYILQLRKKLAVALGADSWAGPKDVLATRNGGYVLAAPAGTRDLDGFERLSREAGLAADPADAYALFNDALALWRGPALADVPVGYTLEREVVRLEERRMKALYERNEVGLRLGLHLDLLSELASLAMHNPMDESLHAQYIVALYRAGRIFDALEAYRRLRKTMVEELGLEPSARLRRLQQAVLAAAPELEPPTGRHRSHTRPAPATPSTWVCAFCSALSAGAGVPTLA